MATWVSLSKVKLTPLNRLTLNTPIGCKHLGYIAYASSVITHYVLKFANFRYHGNRGRSEQSLSDTFKLADP